MFGKHIFLKVKEMNDKGSHIPIWGTCLGFENLAMFSSDDNTTVLDGGLDSDDVNLELHFTKEPAKTRLFSPLGADA